MNWTRYRVATFGNSGSSSGFCMRMETSTCIETDRLHFAWQQENSTLFVSKRSENMKTLRITSQTTLPQQSKHTSCPDNYIINYILTLQSFLRNLSSTVGCRTNKTVNVKTNCLQLKMYYQGLQNKRSHWATSFFGLVLCWIIRSPGLVLSGCSAGDKSKREAKIYIWSQTSDYTNIRKSLLWRLYFKTQLNLFIYFEIRHGPTENRRKKERMLLKTWNDWLVFNDTLIMGTAGKGNRLCMLVCIANETQSCH